MSDEVLCVECGKDLTDPKNRGDPDVDGNWVCSDIVCRAIHESKMTCDQIARSVKAGGAEDA